MTVNVIGNRLTMGFLLLCVLLHTIMTSSTCALTHWFTPNNQLQCCPWRHLKSTFCARHDFKHMNFNLFRARLMHWRQTLDTWQYTCVTGSGKMCTKEYIFAFQPELLNLWIHWPQTPFQGVGAVRLRYRRVRLVLCHRNNKEFRTEIHNRFWLHWIKCLLYGVQLTILSICSVWVSWLKCRSQFWFDQVLQN